jgi:cytochrome c553
MSYKMRTLAATAAIVISGYSVGTHAAMVGDPKAGEEKAGLCGGCHGPDGNSEDANNPRLAGQYAGYIAKQVKDFKAALRANNDTMAGMAATVEADQDAWDIGAYFAQQKMKGSLTQPSKDLVAAGEKIFRNGNTESGVFPCISCHGESGKGKSANNSAFPVIGGQHRDYIIKQLKDFRADARTNDPAGMMNMVAKKLTDKEVEALAEYLSSKL